jgi:glycerophosphoryl diester phosphodiesterase
MKSSKTLEDLFSVPHTVSNIRFIAHRGCLSVAPENSLPAFQEAAKRCFFSIETDVRQTRDGNLVCCHDDTLSRMFSVNELVCNLNLKEIRKHAFTSGSRLEYYPQDNLYMPLFTEYLEICRIHGNIPFIETKDDVVDRVIWEVRNFDMENYSVISSTKFEHLEEVRRINAKIFIHHIFSNEKYMPKLLSLGHAGMAFNYPDLSLIPEGLIEGVHAGGLRICFRAGDSRESVVQMLNMGVDYIPTNIIV